MAGVHVFQGRRLYILRDGVWSAVVRWLRRTWTAASDSETAWHTERVNVAGSQSAAGVCSVWVSTLQTWTASQARPSVSNTTNHCLSVTRYLSIRQYLSYDDWRIIRRIIGTVLCCTVQYNTIVRNHMHTDISSSYRWTVVRWGFVHVLVICDRRSLLVLALASLYLCISSLWLSAPVQSMYDLSNGS